MTASGCLASYGATLGESYAIIAALIDKILKGAQPGDTPAQQPTRFELVSASMWRERSASRSRRRSSPATDEVIE
jgi:putative ABC transport system substrate-binding protein